MKTIGTALLKRRRVAAFLRILGVWAVFSIFFALAQNSTAQIGAMFGGSDELRTRENSLTTVVRDLAASQTLEDEFFALLWRCDSPILVERDSAEDELAREFVKFEPIWRDRAFLTNGEISSEARQRFELAEARRRELAIRNAAAAFRVVCNVDKIDQIRKIGQTGGEKRACRIRVDWAETVRIVYLTPKTNGYVWRDPVDSSQWRPVERFSSPEILPEFEATSLEIETTLERSNDGSSSGNAINSRETSQNWRFDALIGVDCRPFEIPIHYDDLERGLPIEEKATENRFLSFPRKFQSGDLTVSIESVGRDANGETKATLRLDFTEAFDAFDSHRVWFDASDFSLSVGANDSKNGRSAQKFAPIQMRTRERSANGVGVELVFSREALDALDALEQAVKRDFKEKSSDKRTDFAEMAQINVRIPRFWFFFQYPIEEIESESFETLDAR